MIWVVRVTQVIGSIGLPFGTAHTKFSSYSHLIETMGISGTVRAY